LYIKQVRYIVVFVFVVALLFFTLSFKNALTGMTPDETFEKEASEEYQKVAQDILDTETSFVSETDGEKDATGVEKVIEISKDEEDGIKEKAAVEVLPEAPLTEAPKPAEVTSSPAQVKNSGQKAENDVLPGIAVVKATSLNVRSGPGTDYTVSDKVQANTTLPVLGEQNNWYRVLLPGDYEGWVASQFTELLAPDIYSKRTAMINVPSLNLRSGPSTEYSILGSGSLGKEFKIINSVPGWFNVIVENTTAWVSAKHTLLRDGDGGGGEPVLSGKTIVVDPGHGGDDPGAVGRNHRLAEKFVNLDTALRLSQLLENAGAKVVLTRSTDVFIPLSQRVNIAHENNADIFVSIHANAHNDRSVGGIETYYNTSFRPQNSYHLASVLQQELVRELRLRDIGVKTAAFRVIQSTRVPSALVELAFLSNPKEEELLNQASFRQKAAEAVYRGIVRYFQ
jgi:N-acetylmuramoyl-L-alanine amidase